jgi:hypothetical protein
MIAATILSLLYLYPCATNMRTEYRSPLEFAAYATPVVNLVFLGCFLFVFLNADPTPYALSIPFVAFISIALLTSLGLLVIKHWRRKLRSLLRPVPTRKVTESVHSMVMQLRICLAIALVLVDVFFLTLFDVYNGGVMLAMFRERPLMTAAFACLTGFLIFVVWILYRFVTPEMPSGQRQAVMIVGLCVLLLLSYLDVLSAAHSYYNYMPASRGGGDHTKSPGVVLTLVDQVEDTLQPYIESTNQECLRTRPLILMEETSSMYFFADPKDAGGPRAWRAGTGKPVLIGIARDQIRCIQFVESPKE